MDNSGYLYAISLKNKKGTERVDFKVLHGRGFISKMHDVNGAMHTDRFNFLQCIRILCHKPHLNKNAYARISDKSENS